MSDVMLFGVLRMPYDMAMATETSRHQYWQRGQQAADKIEKLDKKVEAMRIVYEPLLKTYAEKVERLEAALRQIAELSDKGSPTVFARDCVFSEIACTALGEKKDG